MKSIYREESNEMQELIKYCEEGKAYIEKFPGEYYAGQRDALWSVIEAAKELAAPRPQPDDKQDEYERGYRDGYNDAVKEARKEIHEHYRPNNE